MGDRSQIIQGWDGVGPIPVRVDSTGAIATTGGSGGTQYAEDSAHVSGDQVTMAGVVQQAADTALSGDGDRSVLQVDGSGHLKVAIKSGAGSGGTASVDDSAFTVASGSGTPAMGLTDEVTPDSVDEGDVGVLRMTADRKLLTRIVGASDANRLDVDASGHAQVDIAAASVTVPISAASLPLPTGAATAANQLPDGHNVTVDNAAGASAVNVQDGGNELTVDQATHDNLNANANIQVANVDVGAGNPVPISAASLPLPTGAATEATLASIDGKIAAFDVDTGVGTENVQGVNLRKAASGGSVEAGTATDPLRVDPTGTTTQPISAASLPLPTGAATAANQLPDGHNVTIDNGAGASAVNIQDGGNTISVDGTVAVTHPAIGGGTEATAQRVTIANDSTGVLSVDDNGTTLSVDDGLGSLTIDNAALSVTGGGTETGALRVTVANNSTGVLSVDDNGSSLTVDNAALSVTGGGIETGALRVTIANNSTGVLSVDDNSSSLTVDQATAANLNAQVVGNVAHDAVDSGNPIKVGGKAATASGPVAVGTGDRVDAWFTTLGQQVNRICGSVATNLLEVGGEGEVLVNGVVAHDVADTGNPVKIGSRVRTSDISAPSNDDISDGISDTAGKIVVSPYSLHQHFTDGYLQTTTTTGAALIAAPGAGRSLYITSISATLTGAATEIGAFRKGAANWMAAILGTATLPIPFAQTFPTPVKIGNNVALNVVTTFGQTVIFTAQGFVGPA